MAASTISCHSSYSTVHFMMPGMMMHGEDETLAANCKRQRCEKKSAASQKSSPARNWRWPPVAKHPLSEKWKALCYQPASRAEIIPLFRDKGQTSWNKEFVALCDDLHTKFSDRRMSDDDQLEFLQYMEYSVTGKKNKKRHVDITPFDSTVEFQLKSLPLTERNELIRLLTHKPGEEDDDDVINEEMLTLLPSLQNRSMILLEKNARKQRADKIDLKFISDFMHDYCRYDRVHHKLITCQTIITTLPLHRFLSAE